MLTGFLNSLQGLRCDALDPIGMIFIANVLHYLANQARHGRAQDEQLGALLVFPNLSARDSATEWDCSSDQRPLTVVPAQIHSSVVRVTREQLEKPHRSATVPCLARFFTVPLSLRLCFLAGAFRERATLPSAHRARVEDSAAVIDTILKIPSNTITSSGQHAARCRDWSGRDASP